MNKKFLLFALPALMVMSSCTYLQSGAVVKDNNLFAEDTLAHEELFGAVEELGELGLDKLAPYKAVSFTSDYIKAGYQINFDNKGDGDASNDTISIRFIAAIKEKGVRAYWHRGFAQPNSYEGVETVEKSGIYKYKLTDAGQESKTIYKTLTDGATPLTCGAEGTEGYTSYEGFVIYTLRNIPYEKYKESYLGAYLELIDPDNDQNKKFSDFVVVKVEKETNYTSENAFAIDSSEYDDKYFLQGIINGSPQRITQKEDGSTYKNNNASYKDITLQSTDYFGSFYFSKSSFKYFSYSGFFDAHSSTYFEESDVVSGFVTPKANKAYVYTLYVSNGEDTENQVYTDQDGDNQLFTITVPKWVVGDSCVLFVTYQRSNDDWVGWTVTNTSSDDDNGYVTFSVSNNIKAFKLCRCIAGSTSPNYSATGNNTGRVYNEMTGDQTVTFGTYSYNCSSWQEHNP